MSEPVAYLKHWTGADTGPCQRVDLHDRLEPWLAALSPTITPLYASDDAKVRAAYALGQQDMQRRAVEVARNLFNIYAADAIAAIPIQDKP